TALPATTTRSFASLTSWLTSKPGGAMKSPGRDAEDFRKFRVRVEGMPRRGLEAAGAGPAARLFAGEHAPRQGRIRSAVAFEDVDQIDLIGALRGTAAVVVGDFVTRGDDGHAVVVVRRP